MPPVYDIDSENGDHNSRETDDAGANTCTSTFEPGSLEEELEMTKQRFGGKKFKLHKLPYKTPGAAKFTLHAFLSPQHSLFSALTACLNWDIGRISTVETLQAFLKSKFHEQDAIEGANKKQA